MDTIVRSFAEALALLMDPGAELIAIVLRTLLISGGALIIAALIGVPMGALLALRRFPLRGIITATLNAFMGLPPVVVGLFIYILLSRSGPLGFMDLLYTPQAMVIAQFVLALPIIAALSASAVVGVSPSLRLAARSMGATPTQETITILHEARYGILSAIIAALGRVMAEVGAILIVGGNIRGHTRVMTTTIAMETDKGDFTLALALGIILLMIAIGVNLLLHMMQRRGSLSRSHQRESV